MTFIYFLALEITDEQKGRPSRDVREDRKRLKGEFNQWKSSKGTSYWMDQHTD